MNRRKILALTLLLCVLSAIAAPLASAQETTIHITDPDGLRKLAADCSLDSYSRNLTVVLDADLDLSGLEVYPIPYFSGRFDGQGHSISGLSLATDGSHQGLFRYLSESGSVKDLTVRGTVAPENGRCQVGGLVGSNSGLIENCAFNGSVSGKNYVGGLVGENHGRILGCSATGTVEGKRFTGGIAGLSDGLIQNCVNQASVNTSISEGGLELESLALSDISTLELTNAEDEDVVSDSGGIVGYSKGIVLSSQNRGDIGYPHYGYNVGGIAGRQSGYLNGCDNYGGIQGRKDVGGLVGQMEPFMILKESVNLAEELELLNDYLNRASTDLGIMSDEVESAMDDISISSGSAENKINSGGTISHAGSGSSAGGGTISGGSGGSISGGSGVTDQDLQDGLNAVDDKTSIDTDNVNVPEGLSEDLNGMAQGMRNLTQAMGSGTGVVADDLQDVNNQLSRCLMLMANALNGAANRQILEDISDQLEEDDPEGRVSENCNYGAVEGDKNIGGIVGDMGVEYEFDMEGTLVEVIGVEGIVSNTYETKCVSDRNINRGTVIARKDDAGGVAGLTELGVIIRCQGYGSVSSTDGRYVGGIVGYSHHIVRDSHAMCDLSGKEYVGGIAGYGTIITGCGSMVGMNDVTACGGAIAGWADMDGTDVIPRDATGEDAEEKSAVRENFFVHDSLGAVDGISYEGKAVPVSYERLMALENLPEQFRTLKLSFLADGVLVDEVEFSYGGTVDASQLPAVPEKEGYTGSWPNVKLNGLTHSMILEAVYTPRQGALAANTTRDGSPMSIVLVEGDFDDSTRINLNGFTGADPELEEGKVLEKWVLQLSKLEENQRYSIRYLPPQLSARSSKVEIYVREDGQWSKVSTTRNGSYLSFESDRPTVIFCAVEARQSPTRMIIYGVAGGAALIGVAAALLLTGKKKKPSPKAESEQKDPAEG